MGRAVGSWPLVVAALALALAPWPAAAQETQPATVERQIDTPAPAAHAAGPSRPAPSGRAVTRESPGRAPAQARVTETPRPAAEAASDEGSRGHGRTWSAESPSANASQARPRTPSGSGSQAQGRGRAPSSPPSSSAGTAERRRYPTTGSDGALVVGRAVPRGSVPTYPVHVGHRGYGYPYYPHYGYWYPWGFGAWGLGFYWWDSAWYGGWGWPGPYRYGYGYTGSWADMGSVRIMVKPRDAQVFVDGYYVGIVDEFDGSYQRLRLETGPRRIEIRKEGFETLRFDVRVIYGHTVKLRGELRPVGALP